MSITKVEGYLTQYLSIESKSRRPTLGADSLRIRLVSSTAVCFQRARDVLQRLHLGPLAMQIGQLSDVRMERHVLDILLLQVFLIVGLERMNKFLSLTLKTNELKENKLTHIQRQAVPTLLTRRMAAIRGLFVRHLPIL
jgi:hypothetical protein